MSKQQNCCVFFVVVQAEAVHRLQDSAIHGCTGPEVAYRVRGAAYRDQGGTRVFVCVCERVCVCVCESVCVCV